MTERRRGGAGPGGGAGTSRVESKGRKGARPAGRASNVRVRVARRGAPIEAGCRAAACSRGRLERLGGCPTRSTREPPRVPRGGRRRARGVNTPPRPRSRSPATRLVIQRIARDGAPSGCSCLNVERVGLRASEAEEAGEGPPSRSRVVEVERARRGCAASVVWERSSRHAGRGIQSDGARLAREIVLRAKISGIIRRSSARFVPERLSAEPRRRPRKTRGRPTETLTSSFVALSCTPRVSRSVPRRDGRRVRAVRGGDRGARGDGEGGGLRPRVRRDERGEGEEASRGGARPPRGAPATIAKAPEHVPAGPPTRRPRSRPGRRDAAAAPPHRVAYLRGSRGASSSASVGEAASPPAAYARPGRLPPGPRPLPARASRRASPRPPRARTRARAARAPQDGRQARASVPRAYDRWSDKTVEGCPRTTTSSRLRLLEAHGEHCRQAGRPHLLAHAPRGPGSSRRRGRTTGTGSCPCGDAGDVREDDQGDERAASRTASFAWSSICEAKRASTPRSEARRTTTSPSPAAADRRARNGNSGP